MAGSRRSPSSHPGRHLDAALPSGAVLLVGHVPILGTRHGRAERGGQRVRRCGPQLVEGDGEQALHLELVLAGDRAVLLQIIWKAIGRSSIDPIS